MGNVAIDRAKEHFGKLLEQQMRRMDYVMDWVMNPKLQQTWEGYVKG
jgi:hypothetical protein